MVSYNVNGTELQISGHPEVYGPSDDTLLLAGAIGNARGRALEIGTGSGMTAIYMAKRGLEVVATDINPHALRLARQNARQNGVSIDIVRADIFDGIGGRFDTIVFNPPYLPTSPGDVTGDRWFDASVNGGPDGLRFTQRFLGGLRERLSGRGKAFILSSSLAGFPARPPPGLAWRVVAEAKLDFELLEVRRIIHC